MGRAEPCHLLEPMDDVVGRLTAKYGKVNQICEWLGKVDGQWRAVPSSSGSQNKGPCARISMMTRAVREIKKLFPEVTVITDVCMCAYTKSGHCGIVKGESVLNDETLPYLAKTALAHAAAGADIVAPSAMMDGQVGAIRKILDKNGFNDVKIMAYSAKYASCLYGPFREAEKSTPSFGDRKSYQMDYRNSKEALLEVKEDIKEGADMVMVKPAHAYLDIIRAVRAAYPEIPLAAYHVSGEYAMLKAAARAGVFDEKAAMMEVLTAIKRAGADTIITYFAVDAARLIGGKK